MSPTRPLIEVLSTSIGAVRLALAGGADRIELCENDPQGGTTPSVGTIATALELAGPLGVPVNVMVRPRGGGFVFDADERRVMRRDISAAVGCGADGIVTGALTPSGEVDRELTAELVDLAAGLPVTFHRGVDVAPDVVAAVTTAFELGCARVLTSGGAPSAIAGSATLAELVRRAPAGAVVIAGGGITSAHVADLVTSTGVRELHVSARAYRVSGASPSPPGMLGVTAGPGPDWPTNGWPAPDPARLSELRAALEP